LILSTVPLWTKQKLKHITRKHQKDWYPIIKKIFKEPEPESDTKPETEKEKLIQKTVDDLSSLNTINIYIIGTAPLAQLARKHRHKIFAITIANIKKALALKKHTDFVIKVPACYYEDLVVFLQKETDKLVEY